MARYQVRRRVNRIPYLLNLPVTLFVMMGGVGLMCLVIIAGALMVGAYIIAVLVIVGYVMAYYVMMSLVRKYGEGFLSKIVGYFLANQFKEVIINKRIKK